MKHTRLRIHGRVHGVFFRDSAFKKAHELGLVGFVRNDLDGSVYIEIEGEEEPLGEFVNWCKDGPPMAEVKEVEVEEDSELRNFKDFRIDETS